MPFLSLNITIQNSPTMSTNKVDYKKDYKDLYLPKQQPMLVDVPAITFIAIEGKGSPQDKEYQDAIQALYALSFTIKMSKMSGSQPEGYFEYVVPPLEGLWWCNDEVFDINKKQSWVWKSMIRQPEFVTQEVFSWAIAECKRKKPEVDTSKAKLVAFNEGLCVQVMHVGPYSEEPASLAKIDEYIEKNSLVNDITRKHHEIYLNDPRQTALDKIKTVLRIPVLRK